VSEVVGDTVVERLTFDLEYDGPSLQTHEMDVRDLAPALLSAGALFRSLNRLAHPADPDIQVNIRATSEGSFHIQLALLYDAAMRVLERPDVEAGGTFIGSLTGILGLALAMIGIRKHRDKRGEPAQVESITPGLVRLIWPDGTVLEVPADAWRLLDDPQIAQPLAEMVRPLGRNGIDTMRIKREGQTAVEVTTEDLSAFGARSESPREILSDSERVAYLTIRNIALDPSLKWRFSDGSHLFAAHITDPDFNDRIERRQESFAKGDQLRAVLRTTQWRDAQGELRSETEVVRVLDHMPPPAPHPSLLPSDGD
jgi:hypothetical protein